MKYLKRPQIVAILLAVLAIVLLLMLPRKGGDRVEKNVGEIQADSADYKAVALSSLDEEGRNFVQAQENLIETESDALEKIGLIDSLSNFWESKGDILLAADELRRIADILTDKASFFIAGDKYYSSFRNSEGSRKHTSLKKAISCYEEVLKLNPEDLEARTSLGVCYVEGASELGEAPMKGIGMLRDVLEDDPENINALVNLGYFASQSGQFDKAIERFRRVLEIDSTFTDAYLYLSDACLQSGDRESAVKYLEDYRRFLDDPAKIEQLDSYIEKVKNNKI